MIIAVFIRMVHATANSGILTSSFAFIAAEFPESVAKMFVSLSFLSLRRKSTVYFTV